MAIFKYIKIGILFKTMTSAFFITMISVLLGKGRKQSKQPLDSLLVCVCVLAKNIATSEEEPAGDAAIHIGRARYTL